MIDSHGKATRHRILGLLVAIVLACGICPVAAFASAEDLTAASVSPAEGIADAQGAALSSQSSGVKSAKKTTKKSAAFTIKKYGKTKKYSGATAKWAYGKPVLKGSSKVVKKINNSLAKRYKEYREQLEGFLRIAKEETRSISLFDTYSTEATYNAKGYVSFRYQWDWFTGGVYNASIVGDVYSLKTGKKLNVSQVVAGNSAQVKQKIVDAFASQHEYMDVYSSGYGGGKSIYNQIMAKDISDIEFYLEGGDVVVVMDPYTIPGQRIALTATLKGNYA